MNEKSVFAFRVVPVAVVARIWHTLLALVIGAAFVTQVVLLATGGADANSGRNGATVGVGTRLVRLLSYFTIESNMIVLAVVITLIRRPDRDGRLWRIAHLDALLGIVITGLVFDIVLDGQVQLSGAAQWATIGFHYVAPWAFLIGWLAFGPRPRITWRTVAPAFIWPVLWIGYTFAHGAGTGWYPYPFLDVGKKGYATALINTGVVLVVGVGLAALFTLLDRLPAPHPDTDIQHSPDRPVAGS